MSDRGPYHRRDRRWSPSPAQTRVLDALAQGLPNAEIAVRLGLSPETVKWHVSELLATTATQNREELAAWWRRRRDRGPRASVILLRVALGGAAAACIIGLLVALYGRRPLARPAGEVAALPTATEDASGYTFPDGTNIPAAELNACPNDPIPDDNGVPAMRTVPPDELASQGLMPLGRLISPAGCQLLIANRADRAYVELPFAAKVFGLEIVAAARYSGWNFAKQFVVDGQSLTVSAYHLYTWDQTYPVTQKGNFGLSATDGSGMGHRVAVDSIGQVWIDPRPISTALVLDNWTGRLLVTTAMTRLGKLVPPGTSAPFPGAGWRFTSCDRDPAGDSLCSVNYRPYAPTAAPVSGTLRCTPQNQLQKDSSGGVIGEFDLDAGDFRLHFQELYTSTTPGLVFSCDSRPVEAGEVIGTHYHYVITAFDKTGQQISVAVALDSTLYVGDIPTKLSCPCTTGS